MQGGVVADEGAVIADEVDDAVADEEVEAGAAVRMRVVDQVASALRRQVLAADDQLLAGAVQGGDGGEIVEAVLGGGGDGSGKQRCGEGGRRKAPCARPYPKTSARSSVEAPSFTSRSST
ncbi:MAG: hypothetical protein JO276_07150 [Sphingomonadaceae bacterium]|nr:hypothetical protein [Sphingomonadaceae bacterium]